MYKKDLPTLTNKPLILRTKNITEKNNAQHNVLSAWQQTTLKNRICMISLMVSLSYTHTGDTLINFYSYRD